MASSVPNTHSASHVIFYTCLTALLAVLVAGWYLGNGSMLAIDGGGYVSLARLFGLLAGFSVLLQVFLMSRVPLVDQRFNLHEIVRLHRWNGYAVVVFLALHVSLMTLGYATLSETGLRDQFLELLANYQDVFKAFLASILILIAVALSIGAARRRVPYEFWYFVHLTLYAAILLALFHQVNSGGDLIKDDWFRYYWLGLYVFVFGIWSYFRGARIGLWAHKHQFQVDRVVQEAEGIYSVYVRGKDLARFHFEPGQYAGWRVLNRKGWWQNHPYSFSDTPGKDTLRFTINTADGPFTKSIPSTAPGTRLLVDGPRGSFTARRIKTTRVVLIAGGIGIAPYIPLIPGLLQAAEDVTLLYAARSPRHCAFGDELGQFRQNGLRLRYFLDDQNARIDETILGKFRGTDVTFYLCGPEPMVASLRAVLLQQGVRASHIVTERFSV